MIALHDRPMASKGLISFRYRSPFGWIMIGATDEAGALREAARSTDAEIDVSNLQRHDGAKYVSSHSFHESEPARLGGATQDRSPLGVLAAGPVVSQGAEQ